MSKDIEKRLSALEECIKNITAGEQKKEFRVKPNENDTFERLNTVHPTDVEVGRICHIGHYINKDGSEYTFGEDRGKIQSYLELDVNEVANLMEAFSNPDRLEIIRCLVNQRMSATELMNKLNISTTGKLYNHLSKLEALNIVRKSGKQYLIHYKAVGGIILMFTAAGRIFRTREN